MHLRAGLISAALAGATLAHARPQPEFDTTITVDSITLTLPTLWPTEWPTGWLTEDLHETEVAEYPSDVFLLHDSSATSGEHSDVSSTSTAADLSLQSPDWTTSTTRGSLASSTESTSASAATFTWQPFDAKCDAGSEKAEDCRASIECDASSGEYPVCRQGECVCRQVTCSADADCTEEGICREDDHYAICLPEPKLPDVSGLCSCKPLIVGCGNRENGQTFCSDQLDCTINKRVFSLWSEFGQCMKGHPEGQCKCQTVLCPFDSNGTKGDDFCKNFVTCPEGAEVACKIQWLGPPNDLGGYCTCAAGPYEPWDPEY